jgi:hypothetical protein
MIEAITDISFLELSIYMRAMRGIGDITYGSLGKPEGKPLFKYGGLFGRKLKVFKNGIQGQYGVLTKKKWGMRGMSMTTYVAVDISNAFIPFSEVDGIYPLEFAYRNPRGDVHPQVGIQVETRDHRTMVYTFDENPLANQQRFKTSLRSFYGLYHDTRTLGGSAHLAGTTNDPLIHYHGDVHKPRVLREARDLNSGSPNVPNSQLRPNVVLGLDVKELSYLSWPEWLGFWVLWLRGTVKALRVEPSEKWLEKRWSVLERILDRLEDAADSRTDFAASAELHYVIGDELVHLHCTLMDGDVQRVNGDRLELAESLVAVAMRLDEDMGDVRELLPRIETLKR